MTNQFTLPLLLIAAMGLAGCDKSSEDHVQDANKHAETADQKQAEGNARQAADEKMQADKDYAAARDARATEDRHQPPSLTSPGYLKAPEKK